MQSFPAVEVLTALLSFSIRQNWKTPLTWVLTISSPPSAHSSSNTSAHCQPVTCKKKFSYTCSVVLIFDFRSVQLAGAVSLVQCPGAPRIPFFSGRAPPVAAAPTGLVPQPFDSVASILQRFGEVGFSPEEVVAVVGGSHSVAGADDIVPNMQG